MIDLSVTVRVSIERAFEVWTEHINAWWPLDHRRFGRDDDTLHLDARVGGSFEERTADGRTHPMGKVVECAPPELLRLDFYLGSTPDHPSSVAIHFEAVDSGTRVRVVHTAGQMNPTEFKKRAGTFAKNWPHLLHNFSKRTQRFGSQTD